MTLDLAKYGITDVKQVVHNPSYEQLHKDETAEGLVGYEKGVVTKLGSMNVMTGIYTGRSPKDKFFVVDDVSKDTVWWTSEEYKNDNKPLSEASWKILKDKAIDELSHKDRLYVVDAFCGANKNTRLKVRFIMEVAWQAHFVTNMFIRPTPKELEDFGEPDFVIIVFNVDHEAGGFQHFHGFAACVKAVHAVEFGHFRAVDMTVGGKDVDNFQVEFPAYFKVGLIMGRSDFQSARAEFYFYIFISDDRNGGGIERAHDVFPDEVGVPRILRVDGHSHVRHDGFRAGGGYMEGSGPVFQFVKNGVELAFLLSHDDFFIREGREGYRAPVDHAAAPVDESFLKEFNEDLSNGFGVFLIHREAFAVPVAGTTQLMELVDDDASVFFFPFPDFFQESFSAQIVAAPARCLFEVFFHPYLRGDSGMVCSG